MYVQMSTRRTVLRYSGSQRRLSEFDSAGSDGSTGGAGAEAADALDAVAGSISGRLAVRRGLLASLALSASGQVRYQLKTPYRDGTTHIVLAPLDFMARLAALVPPPRMHLPLGARAPPVQASLL
jgi:hypothetical protein